MKGCSRPSLPLLALVLVLPFFLLACAKKQQQLVEELQRCSDDALSDSDLVWGDRGPAEALGFVTPWNGKGYSVAETHAPKLSHVSPVWYQIRGEGDNDELVLTGGHDVDSDWIDRVRAVGASCAASGGTAAAADGCSLVKIVPRVLWEVNALLTQPQILQVVLLISREVKSRGYDGVVLEMPIDPGAVVFKMLVASLRTSLPAGSTIIVAIPAFQSPMRGGPAQLQVTPQALAALEPKVDRFLAMCYDALTQEGRTNSPLGFVKATVEQLAGTEAAVRRKMLVSLPWYGYDNGRAVLGHDVARRLLLREGVVAGSAKVEWDAGTEEMVFGYSLVEEGGAPHVGTYPTPDFFRRRLQLIQDEGLAGIAIWELGQGLACFPRLL